MADTKAPAVAPEAATYAKLFPEQLADRCAPDALESNSGPIAYLHALYQQVLALEATEPAQHPEPLQETSEDDVKGHKVEDEDEDEVRARDEDLNEWRNEDGDQEEFLLKKAQERAQKKERERRERERRERRERERKLVMDKRFTLANRRPDIGELLLDEAGLETKVAPLTLAINAMTRQAKTHVGPDKRLTEVISESTQRAGLPFHYPLEQIQAVLKQKKIPLFDLLQQAEYTYPNFCYGNLRTEELRQVMRTSTGFSPALQTLLLDDGAGDKDDFLAKRFGVTGKNTAIVKQLSNVEFFCQKTGLKPEDVQDMLAIEGVDDNADKGFTSVRCSSAYQPSGKTSVDGSVYGASFINNAKAAVLLEDTFAEAGITLGIKGATAAHFGRMNQIIHLRHALKLSFAETDLLLMSALRAEGQTKDFHITANTLRALGVFRYLNEVHGITAEQFAALIHEVSPYAVGGKVPLLDRVLDGPGAGELAKTDDQLIIDDREFDLAGTADEEGKSPSNTIIGHLSSAMGTNEALTRSYLAQASNALGQKKTSLSLALVTSLYRLSRLPRLLGMSFSEGADLLALLALDNPQVQSIVAGKGQISDDPDNADTLDVLIALTNVRQWLKRNQLSASAVLVLLSVPEQKNAVLDALQTARDESGKQKQLDISATCLTEEQIKGTLLSADVLQAGTWVKLLDGYLSERGLVKTDLPAESDLRTALEKLLEGKLAAGASDKATIAQKLASALTNARVKQEDVAKDLFSEAFASLLGSPSTASAYALPLLKWIGKGPIDLLADYQKSGPVDNESFEFWKDMARYTLAIQLTGLSPAGLEALVKNPQWFDFEDEFAVETATDDDSTTTPPTLSLDLLYQLTRYRDWIAICREQKKEETEALKYLADVKPSEKPDAVRSAASSLSKLIGWSESETLLAVPYVVTTVPGQPGIIKGSVDEFLSLLSSDERKHYDKPSRGLKQTFGNYYERYKGSSYADRFSESTYQKFQKFIDDNAGILKLTQEDYKKYNKSATWPWYAQNNTNRGRETVNTTLIELQVYTDEELKIKAGNPIITSELPATPNCISDIDFILRTKLLCERTSLSCQSLLDLALLDETSAYEEFSNTSHLLFGAREEQALEAINPLLQEKWRDALVDYLLGYWAPADATRQAELKTADDLSSYFLTDISPTSEAMKTTTITQAISSLQHYLFRLFSHLEPGYDAATMPEHANSDWEQYLSQYGSWKVWKAQFNHPENLIYYANRPKKSKAFEELEVEVNQGKLDTELLQTAICNYLTKFERLSNLQIVSGYLDGRDPKNDTYYLVGKTNATPSEYYWRSVDMGLRDDQQRLSPLAWSEWQKIGLTTTGKIAQSTFLEKSMEKEDEDGEKVKDEKGNVVKVPPEDVLHTRDAIRLVVISGRLYVFWVEKGTTGLPSTDPTIKDPTPYKKISVHYAYLQSDGFWSTANELMALDGFVNGERPKDEKGRYIEDDDNYWMKADTWIPGLIVFVNIEGKREADPWLTVMLYNCNATKEKDKEINKGYHIEMRDLLLVKKQELPLDDQIKLYETSSKSFGDIRKIQHVYNGQNTLFSFEDFTGDPKPDKSKKNTLECQMSSFQATLLDEQNKSIELTIHYTGPNNNSDYTFKKEDPDTSISIELYCKGNKDYIPLNVCSITDDSITAKYQVSNLGEHEVCLDVDEPLNHERAFLGTFTIEKIKTDESWSIAITEVSNQAHFLDLTSIKDEAPKFTSNKVRLNTLFGKQLVARASQSVEKALDWAAQKIQEPTIDEAYPNPPVDFHGANGLYFRELFLHLPALIAKRLTEQQQFEDAEKWYLRYLFDPYRAQAQDDGRPAYWNTRPLAEVGSGKSELNKPVDPTARAFILSRFYRQAVFLNLVENWQLQGDHYYRQLTLSTLNHAWLCYQQALKLIGPLAERAAVSRWTPMSLSSVNDESFRSPVNQRVIDARKTLEHRLYNLRHGLTLDGKALPNLGWGDEGGDPFASAKGGLSILPTSYNSDRAAIPAYRFRELLPTARAAAQQLLDFGRYYMKLMEDEFNTSLSVLLKAQEIKISDFALRLQKEAIASIKAQKSHLEMSRQAAEFRKEHWAKLLDIGRSPREEAATALTWTAGILQYAAIPTEAYAAGVEGILPKIFGMSVGGAEPEELARMASKAMSMTSTGMKFAAAQLLAESGYERRATGWTFDMRQAEWDMKLIDQQIAEINIELNAAIISLEEARQERANLEEAYVAMTTGFTIIPIYNWLVARQELLYAKAYDAVLSLCLGLEAAWRYEIGDYKRDAFIKTRAWSDSYKGMLAGESLLLDLMEMENAFLLENERRLTIRKTFSLSSLFTGTSPARTDGALKTKALTTWLNAVVDLSEGKPVIFDLKAEAFEKNYPGQYLRQLRYVTVSFVMETGASAVGLCAILTQTGSTTLVAPEKEGVEYLYGARTTPPSSIKRNLRGQQAIALSSAVAEDGLGYNPGESVHELAFHDGRYMPFEGTGAISQWELKIPDLDFAKTLAVITPAAAPFAKSNIKDILINVVYTAKADGRLATIVKDVKDAKIKADADAKALADAEAKAKAAAAAAAKPAPAPVKK